MRFRYSYHPLVGVVLFLNIIYSGGDLALGGSLDADRHASGQAANLDADATSALQLRIASATLTNRGGSLLQSGSGAASIQASTLLDNSGGLIAGHGALSLSVGELINQGGSVQAGGLTSELAISASGRIDNRTSNGIAGKLAASGNTHISADSLDNRQGQISAGLGLDVSTTLTLDNSQGLLAANQQVVVSGGRIDNRSGRIGSVQSQASITASAGLDNAAGRIEAAQSLAVTALGLDNRDGVITGSSLRVDSREHTLDNTRGQLATTGAADSGTLEIQSGALNNEAGLIQTHGALAIDTHGQGLGNTNSGASGGITSQSSITLTTGDLDNTAGYIGSSGALAANSAAIDNTQGGVIASAAQLNLNGNALDNQGGQIQALGNVGINLSGDLNNTASLVRSGQTLSITANSIINANTQGNNQGLEGQSVSLNAQQINNGSGAVRADDALTATSGGSIDNTQGLISSGRTATLQDTHPANKTLAILNAGGTLIAGQWLGIDSASLSGDGDLLSQGGLAITLAQDYTHSGRLQADGDARLETAGSLINQSTLLAGNALHLKAASLDNQAAGRIIGQSVVLTASGSHTLTNRGLIDGQDTFIETITLNNLGTGRIYGDHIAIGATTVTNDAENGVAPVIAARDRLDLGATTITNREHALIFSAGDLAIGGSLDANKQATGQAATLTNASATIEALGNLDLNARQINNSNEHFSTQEVERSRTAMSHQSGDTIYNYTRVITETQVQSSDPAQILSGGAMHLTADNLLNDNSRIIAGGALTGAIGSLTNTAIAGNHTVTDSGTATRSWTECSKKIFGWCVSHRDRSETTAYNPPPTVTSITLTPTLYLQNTAPTGSGTQIAALSAGSVNQTPTAASAASVTLNTGSAISPITQIAALNGNNAGGPATVVRSGGIDTRVPNNRLFSVSSNPSAGYLIETDPQFAHYRQWLSSDTLLQALQLDPATTQKRLGDGYYEQKLLREQVAQLTGRRFLDGHSNDETQYQALMDNGATYARQWNLTPGIALSAGQMAALTSDLVWLVEQAITLPDGSTTRALVPQLYVRVQDGDLQASGALIAGHSVGLELTGDLANSGTIAGRSVVALTAENLKNLGGRISGNDLALTARSDLTHQGGIIEGMNRLTASAGRDLNVTSTTRSSSNQIGANTSSRTNIDRLATLYGGSGGLQLLAGRDLDLNALQATSAGGAQIAAGRDLRLGTVSESQSNHLAWSSNNTRSDSTTAETGTTLQTQGGLRLSAGNDLTARAATATSGGTLTAAAGNNLTLQAGQTTQTVDEAHQRSSKGFLSKKTTTTRDILEQTTAQATTFSGQTLDLQAGHDLKIIGSNAVSDLGTTLVAGHDLILEAASNTTLESHFKDEKKSGLFGSGGLGLTLGTRQQSVDSQNTRTTAAASTVGSTQGNIAIQAGKTYTQTGSDLLAPQGDIDINAQTINIQEARETNQSSTETRFKQSGLSVALTSPIISAIQTAQQMSQAAGNTGDPRMKALAAANTALAGKNAADAVKAGQGTTLNGKPNQMPVTNDKGEVTGSRDATAAEQMGGINLSLSIGASQSQSNSVQTATTAAGSTVAAGGNINLAATGADTDSDLTIQGSTVQAGNDATLKADDEINLLAAKNTADQRSSNKNSSASIGVSIGTNTGVTLSASQGRGNADGNDVTWSNTHLEAGNRLSLESGGDTTLKGAVASGKQVIADVGGNLTLESLQDSSQYASKQQSVGGSVTLGPAPGGSLNASKSSIASDFASVSEQSGLLAGDGGFNINVQGNIDLKGAVIASTQAAIDQGLNRFQTDGTLTTSDIDNRASYSAKSAGVNLGSSVSLDGKLTPSGTSAGIGKDSGAAGSTTKAGISGLAGNKAARTGDAQTGITPIFDADKVQKEINAQVQITQLFGQQASKAIGDYAAGKTREAAALRDQAGKESDPGRIRELKAQAQTLEEQWGDKGTLRLAAHTLVGGLTGGTNGAAGAAAGTLTAPEVAKMLNDASVDPNLTKVLTAIASTTVGGIVGGTAGAGAALNEVANNYLTHTQQAAHKQALKDCKTRACKAGVNLRYAGIGALQDVGLVVGVGGGMGYQAYEQGAAVVEMVKNLPETLTALKAIVNDPEFRARVGNQIADDYKQRIDMQTRAYNDGGWDGSITAGVEAGRLAVDVVSAALVVKSAAQLSGTLAKAGVSVSANALETLSGLAKFDSLVAKGGLFAADGKPLMDFSKLTSAQKGVAGELLGADKMTQLLPDSQKIGRATSVGQSGIDDLYKVNKPGVDYVVVEYKFGSSPLGKTADGLQMSDDWLTGSVTGKNRILDSLEGNRIEANKFRAAFESGRVTTQEPLLDEPKFKRIEAGAVCLGRSG